MASEVRPLTAEEIAELRRFPNRHLFTRAWLATLGQSDKRIAELEALVLHMWIHDDYPTNGYRQMTTEQKQLFSGIIGAKYGSLEPSFEYAALEAGKDRG